MSKGLVTVFGADGFLGHHVVRVLVKDGWRVRAAVRRPHTAQDLRVCGAVGQVQLVQANIRYRQSIDTALHGVDAVINLVGVLYSKGHQNFNAVHNVAVKSIGDAAAARGITNVLHVSALGADEKSHSHYLQSKAKGEAALQAALPSADIVRPSILFGKGEQFFSRFAAMTSYSPALPLIGGGKTRLQPVYVDDAARHILGCINRGTKGDIYELGGPRAYTFKELMQFTLTAIHKKRILLPVPWMLAGFIGFIYDIINHIPIVNMLITPMITADQVKSLKTDNVVSGNYPGLVIDDDTPTTIEAIVPETLIPYRKHGQFYDTVASEG